MNKLVWSQAKSVIRRVAGGCSDATALALANEAQERLLNRPNDPIGSWMRYRVCVGTDNMLVWPRQVRTIKAVWICNSPIAFRSEWFEAVGYGDGGRGLRDEDSGYSGNLLDHGTVCSFSNVAATTAAPKKIQAVAADASDEGKTIHLRYVKSDGNRYYTEDGEGEDLTLSISGTLTTNNVVRNGLYHVVKAQTNFPVRLYSYDVTTSAQDELIALYEPSETTPIYRRTYLPGLVNMAACSGASESCTNNKVCTILARLQHVPVVADNDPFVIGNLAALKLMAKGIMMEEQHEIGMAEQFFASAAREIDGEIAAYLGDGMQQGIRAENTELWGAGFGNLIC
jgi:hypothetical protein